MIIKTTAFWTPVVSKLARLPLNVISDSLNLHKIAIELRGKMMLKWLKINYRVKTIQKRNVSKQDSQTEIKGSSAN